MLTQRQEKILNLIIEEYIRTSQPVGSEFLAKRLGKISPATIRNEMTALTQDNFLAQPHTSAGRVPSESAYRYYLDHLKIKERPSPEINFWKNLLSQNKHESKDLILKKIAKEMANATEEAILLAFDKNDYYYTGFTFLFGQPEFADLKLIHRFSEVIDRADEVWGEFLPSLNRKELQIFLGEACPFGRACSLITVPTDFIGNRQTVISLLGPMRMNYNKNIALMRNLKEMLSKI